MAIKATAKKPLFGNNVSHAKNRTRHAQKPNLQTIKVDGKKFKLSARELRSFQKGE